VRVLVLGGTGFIGRPTVRRLVSSGHDVAVLHRGESWETVSDVPAGVGSFVGDRRHIATYAPHLRAWKPEVVVDFIAFTETDVRGVLSALAGVARRLVVLSSLDVYRAYDRFTRVQSGPPEPTPIGEDAPLREVAFPRRRWASGPGDVAWEYDKILVERAAQSDPQLPGTVLRLPAVYGPGDGRRRRVGAIVERIDSGSSALELDEELSRWRWTRGYVEDIADAIALASIDPRASGRTYNVGEEAPLSEGEWVSAIARVAGYAAMGGKVVEKKRAELHPDVARELEAHDFAQDIVLDTSRIQRELGWRPRVPLDDGLAASIAWERQEAASRREISHT
jgi:nucleoside-diphosphate-sugar epimerase